MNILLQVNDKFSHFGARQNEALMLMISPEMYKADQYTQGAIVKMIRLLTEDTSAYEVETIIRCLQEVTLFGNTTPVIFIVNKGENFAFEVDLEPGKSFVGHYLCVYNAETGVALGPQVEGTNDDKQEVSVIDCDLTPGHTYRIHVVLQIDDTPSAVLLTEAFIIVEDNIDYNEE